MHPKAAPAGTGSLAVTGAKVWEVCREQVVYGQEESRMEQREVG